MQESKQYLEKSIRCYQSLLEHVHDFKNSLDKGILSAEEFNTYNAKLQDLQQKVEQADRDFSTRFNEKTDSLITDTLLYQKKISMMKEILELNDFLLPRLASLMDITRDELKNLKNNVKTIGGYHSGHNQKKSSGRIIKRSC